MYNSFESISVKTRLTRPACLSSDWSTPPEPLTYEQMEGAGHFGTEEQSIQSFEQLELKRKSKSKYKKR